MSSNWNDWRDPDLVAQRDRQIGLGMTEGDLAASPAKPKLAEQPEHAKETGQPPSINPPRYQPAQLSVLGQLAAHARPGSLLSIVGAGEITKYQNQVHANQMEHQRYQDEMEAARYAHQRNQNLQRVETVDDDGNAVTKYVEPHPGDTFRQPIKRNPIRVITRGSDGTDRWTLMYPNGDTVDTGEEARPMRTTPEEGALEDYIKAHPGTNKFDAYKAVKSAGAQAQQDAKPEREPHAKWQLQMLDGKPVRINVDSGEVIPVQATSMQRPGTQKTPTAEKSLVQRKRELIDAQAKKKGRPLTADEVRNISTQIGAESADSHVGLGLNGQPVGGPPPPAGGATRPDAVDEATFRQAWQKARPGQPLTPQDIQDARATGAIR